MELDDELTAEIKAQVEEWSSNSNECFNITLLRADKSEHASFQPDFTYPFFGEEEAIFGYQDLEIDLTFQSHDMSPRLRVSYSKKFDALGDIKPTNIIEVLQEFLPGEAFSTKDADAASSSSFQPPGEKIKEYTREEDFFEVWCASLSDPAARKLLENMEILIPMFIEGGSMLQLEQDWSTQRWKLFTLYQRFPGASPNYSLVGYGTSYRIFTLPDRKNPEQADIDMLGPGQSLLDLLPSTSDGTATASPAVASPLDLPSRERLSQFLILPSFQGTGHGQELYNAMYTQLTAPSNVRELTVEDPNEAFDDLRDFCDLIHLRDHNPAFASLKVNTDIPADQLGSKEAIPIDLIVSEAIREKIRRETKIDKRQFDRLLEMHLLSFIPPLHRSRSRITRREKSSNANDKAYYFWRLYAKYRLYIFNRDQLIQLDHEERIEKLEAALDSVQEGYVSMLDKISNRVISEPNGRSVDAGAGRPSKRAGKRKVIEDDDEDEDEDEDMASDESRKKTRFS